MTSRTSLGAILACIVIALSGCGAGGPDSAEAAKGDISAAPVVVASEVSPAAPDALIRATGTIVYERETTLSFKTGGIIAELSVDEGDPVKAGQRLARLDLTELAAGLAQAEAGVANADVQ